MNRTINGYAYDEMQPYWIKKLIGDNENKWTNFSDVELIRWLYIELGKQFSFDKKYRYSMTNKEKTKLESAARDVVNRTIRLNRTSEVTCIDITEALRMVLEDVFLLEAKVRIDGSGPHVYLEVFLSDEKGSIRLDLQEDLYNIKAGRRTEYFAQQDQYDGRTFKTIPQSRIEEIDKKIGYIPENEKYMEDILAEFQEDIDKCGTTQDKVEKVFTLLEAKFFKKLKNMGICEHIELFKKVLAEMIPQNCIELRTFLNARKDLSSIFIVPSNSEEIPTNPPTYYLYDIQKRQYVQITRRTF